jgi:6-phosphogluconate dehydrogenase
VKLGFIGLGKMGSRMAAKLFAEQHELIVWNRSPAACEVLKKECEMSEPGGIDRLDIAGAISQVVAKLVRPRVVWLMLPAGEATESVLKTLTGLLQPGDILIDGGNSHFKDTERRFNFLKERDIRFLGIGVSGGIIAAREGYPLMAGGDRSAYDYITPVLNSLSKPRGGHEYFGTGGAGHFVKMIHNGIEYGIMQSLGEGFEVLEKSPYKLDLLKVAQLYQKGTLVSGFMLDRAVEVFTSNPDLSSIKGVIAESGEAQWTVQQARDEGVEVDIINRSLEYRKRSQSDEKVQNSFTARLVAALRNAFGGHDLQTK